MKSRLYVCHLTPVALFACIALTSFLHGSEVAHYEAKFGVSQSASNHVESWLPSRSGEFDPFDSSYPILRPTNAAPSQLATTLTPNGHPVIRFSNPSSDNQSLSGYCALDGVLEFTAAVTFYPGSEHENEPRLLSTENSNEHWALTLPTTSSIRLMLDDNFITMLLPSSLQSAWRTALVTWKSKGEGMGYDYGLAVYDATGTVRAQNFGSFDEPGGQENDHGEKARNANGITIGAQNNFKSFNNFDGGIAGVRLFDHYSDPTEAAEIGESMAARYTFVSDPMEIEVTNTNDNGAGSLRAAIEAAKNHKGDDVITFRSGLNNSVITLTSGELLIDEPTGRVTIDASSLSQGITIDGNAADRVLHVENVSSRVTLRNLTIQNGLPVDDGDGGGIRSVGELILENSSVSGNRTQDMSSGGHLGYGGGIYSFGTTDISGSTISGNIAAPGRGSESDGGAPGGGIFHAGGILTISDSTVTANSAGNGSGSGRGGNGGGIYNWGDMTLTMSTVSRNQTGDGGMEENAYGGDGGGIYSGGKARISFSSVSENETGEGNGTRNGGAGGGITNHSEMVISNSSVTGNRTGDGDFTEGRGGTGGGIYNTRSLSLSQATIADNIAGNGRTGGHTGGIYSSIGTTTSLTISNSTVVGNRSGKGAFPGYVGGIFISTSSGTATIRDSIIAGNVAENGLGPDISSDDNLTREGTNLIGDNSLSTGFASTIFPAPTEPGQPNENGDYVGNFLQPLDPKLAPLQNNGGVTETRLPERGSLAIDPPHGTAGGGGDGTDQRGPGFPRIVGGIQDIGAAEAPDYAAIAAARAVKRASLSRQIRKFKKKLKTAKRRKQVSKVKRFKKKLKKLKRQLRAV